MDSNLCAGITLDKNENLDFCFKPLGRNKSLDLLSGLN